MDEIRCLTKRERLEWLLDTLYKEKIELEKETKEVEKEYRLLLKRELKNDE